MSNSGSTWAELASQHERLAWQPERQLQPTGVTVDDMRPQWAELASQSERLANVSDPLFRLASSGHSIAGMRLVASVG